MITLQPQTKTRLVVDSLTRLGVFCPVEEFKLELVDFGGEALQEVVRDDSNNAAFIAVSADRGTGWIDLRLHTPSGKPLEKRFDVAVVEVGQDPDDFTLAKTDY